MSRKSNRTFRLCARPVVAIEQMAKEENRTTNNMVETILKRYVEKKQTPK